MDARWHLGSALGLSRTLAGQSVLSFLSRLAALAGGFLFTIGVARLLGASGFGKVAMALSISTTGATIVLLGTNGLAVREVARAMDRQAWGELAGFCRRSASVALILAIVGAIALSQAARFDQTYSIALLFAALLLPVQAGLLWLRGVLQGMGAPVLAQLPLDLIRWIAALAALGTLFLVQGEMGVAEALGAYLVALILSLVVGVIALRRRFPVSEKPIHRPWLRQSLPFLGIAIFGILGTELNTILLGVFSGPTETGLYQPIARLASIMVLAREAIDVPLAPKIVGMWEHGQTDKLRQMLRRAALSCAMVTACIVGIILIASQWILAAYGPEFVEYRHYLFWIAGAQLLNVSLGPAPQLLAMSGSMRQRMAAQAATFFVQVSTAVALIPAFGSTGALISLVAAIVIWAIAHWLLAWRATGLETSIFSLLLNLRQARP